MEQKIDVHAHFLPVFYKTILQQHGIVQPDGMPATPGWSEDEAIRTMDKLEVDKAILSISSPGVYFGNEDEAVEIASRVNSFAHDLGKRSNERFAWFAATPSPNVSAAIKEATHSLDSLRAQGVVVESNHAGRYLGDARLNEFYAALDQREAVVFIHPTSPSCVACDSLALGLPHPMLEFVFDTTRTVTNLVLSGVTTRYPKLRFIIPHAGAALSVLASRVDMLTTALHEGKPSLRKELHRFFFDLAGAPLPDALPALLKIVDPSHILYGSDWPFTPTETCVELAERIVAVVNSDNTAIGFLRRNALALFPSLG